MADQMGAPKFLTVAEVAELMRLSKMTVYRMVHAGDLPAVRMGRSFRVPQAAVEDIIAKGLGDWDQDRADGAR
ncbi:helix-turn-helix domain-containing protein [Georgenia sp. TF02-10]|uniref:helix-turn-helix domain-containing protein n=1 Tax=Georgenia sp. TF02-10 TaxID=2917725 RepID=UPI001FA7CAED|nr:helix-turn-helix domain-containing protein [Georgenia sp. TF02-10]UNX56481.1 helix-turn-helix domain-containing protein [Georgenia sp. TF02-10]